MQSNGRSPPVPSSFSDLKKDQGTADVSYQ